MAAFLSRGHLMSSYSRLGIKKELYYSNKALRFFFPFFPVLSCNRRLESPKAGQYQSIRLILSESHNLLQTSAVKKSTPALEISKESGNASVCPPIVFEKVGTWIKSSHRLYAATRSDSHARWHKISLKALQPSRCPSLNAHKRHRSFLYCYFKSTQIIQFHKVAALFNVASV